MNGQATNDEMNSWLIADDVSDALEQWRRSGFSLDGIPPEMVSRMKVRLDDEIAWSRAEQQRLRATTTGQ